MSIVKIDSVSGLIRVDDYEGEARIVSDTAAQIVNKLSEIIPAEKLRLEKERKFFGIKRISGTTDENKERPALMIWRHNAVIKFCCSQGEVLILDRFDENKTRLSIDQAADLLANLGDEWGVPSFKPGEIGTKAYWAEGLYGQKYINLIDSNGTEISWRETGDEGLTYLHGWFLCGEAKVTSVEIESIEECPDVEDFNAQLAGYLIDESYQKEGECLTVSYASFRLTNGSDEMFLHFFVGDERYDYKITMRKQSGETVEVFIG